MKQYLGLGKTLYNSSICKIDADEHQLQVEVILNERVTRQKANGCWPKMPLAMLSPTIDLQQVEMAETRDVITAKMKEDYLDQNLPFYSHLEKAGLHVFTQKYGTIEAVPHHLAHAYCALAMSPFEKSIIVVIDGAGSRFSDFKNHWSKKFSPPNEDNLEECSIFLQNHEQLIEVEKYWQHFSPSTKHQGHSFSSGLGTLYEKAAEFIFNSNQASGKVMGLAPFGKAIAIDDSQEFLESLDWSKAFKGKGKREWENSPHQQLYRDLAASVQKEFENRMDKLARELRERYPDYSNLILVGGCALNCSSNKKLLQSKYFEQIYIPPFPGDSGVSFGIAHLLLFRHFPNHWKPIPASTQHGYFGPRSSIPTDDAVTKLFSQFNISKPKNLFHSTAELLQEGKIIAWYQGRSESGPRALGNRSILAAADRRDLKNYLNQKIKFREDFRPYGCSCIPEYASTYFDIPQHFANPYMSFAIDVKNEYRERLKEVSHVDGTSRMQIVSPKQNASFYQLIKAFGDLSGLYCLANTSLNIMGEPIVESLEDLLHFFINSDVDGLVVGDYFVKK